MLPIQCFEPVIDERVKLLIVGSMPGEASLRQQQYYANPRNHFWNILFTLFEAPRETDYQKRLAFLLSKGIGLWDVIYTCEREGSLDSNIKKATVNDFHSLLTNFPAVKCIVCNGAKAYDTFQKQVKPNLPYELLVKRLPSTSPTPGRIIKTFEQKLEQWQFVREYLSRLE